MYNLRIASLILEVLYEVQQSSCRALARDGQSSRIGNEANLILVAQLLLGLSQLSQSRRRVVGAVKACLLGVELVKTLIDISQRFLFRGQCSRSCTSIFGIGLQAERYPPQGIVFGGLDVASGEETRLADADLSRFFCDCKNGEADLANPGVHEGIHIFARGFTESGPKIICCCVTCQASAILYEEGFSKSSKRDE